MLPGSACLLGMVQLRGRGCSAPCGVGGHYLEGSWCWEDRWELGVGTPGPLIWCHLNACIWFWLIVIAVRYIYIYIYISMHSVAEGCYSDASRWIQSLYWWSSSQAKATTQAEARPKGKDSTARSHQGRSVFFSHAMAILNQTNLCIQHHQRMIKPCQVMKDASAAILECKSWKSKLEAAGAQEPQYFFFTLIRLHVEIPA